MAEAPLIERRLPGLCGWHSRYDPARTRFMFEPMRAICRARSRSTSRASAVQVCVRAIAWRSSSGQRHARRGGPPPNVGSRTLSQALDSHFCLRSSSPIALQYLVSSESGSWSRWRLKFIEPRRLLLLKRGVLPVVQLLRPLKERPLRFDDISVILTSPQQLGLVRRRATR